MSLFKAIVQRWPAISRSLPQFAAAQRRRSRLQFKLEHLEGRVVPTTILVTSLLDSGHGTLRDAIERANHAPSHSGARTHSDTIKFAHSVRGTIRLTTALPVLLTHTVISGPGPALLTVTRDSTSLQSLRIFTVGTGARVAISGLTINGGSSTAGGGINNAGSLLLKNMWISDNETFGGLVITQGNTLGGGIDNTGTLSVNNCRFDGNTALGGDSAAYGGAIANSGKLTVTNSSFVGNRVMGGVIDLFGGIAGGGAIENAAGGRAAVTGHTTFSGNSVMGAPSSGGAPDAAYGGAIDNFGMLSITGATFGFNAATGGSQGSGKLAEGDGGAIENRATLSISRSVFNGNSATGDTGNGGAIDNAAGLLSVTTSTFSANVAKSDPNSESFGGAIKSTGTLSVKSSTFSGNSATSGNHSYGGGIENAGTLTVTNSTFDGNSATGVEGSFGGAIADSGVMSIVYITANNNSAVTGAGVAIISGGQSQGDSIDSIFQNSEGGNVAVIAGSFASLGHNLFSDNPAINHETTDQVNTDPLLRPLAGNGGPTQTEALMPGSHAIKAGISVAGIKTDQRGAPRPRKRATAIGAFQVQINGKRQDVTLRASSWLQGRRSSR